MFINSVNPNLHRRGSTVGFRRTSLRDLLSEHGNLVSHELASVQPQTTLKVDRVWYHTAGEEKTTPSTGDQLEASLNQLLMGRLVTGARGEPGTLHKHRNEPASWTLRVKNVYLRRLTITLLIAIF